MRLPPGTQVDGVPRSSGTVGHLLVHMGTVIAGPTADPVELAAEAS